MRCSVCGKGPMDGVTVYRVNAKGEKGVWACRQHKLTPPDPEVERLDAILNKQGG